jgi:hypothetical protein
MAELAKTSREKLPNKDFAEPSKRAYPIEDKPHARNAKARASALKSRVEYRKLSKPKSTARPMSC